MQAPNKSSFPLFSPVLLAGFAALGTPFQVQIGQSNQCEDLSGVLRDPR